LPTVEEIGRELIEGVTEATGASTGAVYLSESADTRYRLRGHIGGAKLATVIEGTSSLLSWARAHDVSVPLPPDVCASLAPPSPAVALVAPLRWRASVVRVLVLGPAPRRAAP